MTPRTALALLLCATPLAAAPVPKALKKPLPTLDGTWRMVLEEKDGRAEQVTEGYLTLWKMDVGIVTRAREWEGKTEVFYTHQFTSEMNRDGVRTFDYSKDEDDKDPHRRGVCELDGNTLRIAFGAKSLTPPKAVKSEPGSGVMVYTFRRVTDSK